MFMYTSDLPVPFSNKMLYRALSLLMNVDHMANSKALVRNPINLIFSNIYN